MGSSSGAGSAARARVEVGGGAPRAGVEDRVRSPRPGSDDRHWTAYGACARNARPDSLFVQGAAQREARAVCESCAVRLECLVDALDHQVPFGVWGGMTERQRRALLRSRPDVTSWREVLEAEPSLLGP